MFSHIVASLALFFFIAAMIYAALQDAATLTIRNRLVLILAAGYVVFAPLAGFGVIEFAQGIGTGALCLVATFTLFAFGVIGGGDAKLVAAAAVWLGPEGALLFMLYTMLIGGLLAASILMVRAIPLPAAVAGQTWILRLQSRQIALPYALAIAPGALLALPTTHWFALVA